MSFWYAIDELLLFVWRYSIQRLLFLTKELSETEDSDAPLLSSASSTWNMLKLEILIERELLRRYCGVASAPVQSFKVYFSYVIAYSFLIKYFYFVATFY